MLFGRQIVLSVINSIHTHKSSICVENNIKNKVMAPPCADSYEISLSFLPFT